MNIEWPNIKAQQDKYHMFDTAGHLEKLSKMGIFIWFLDLNHFFKMETA